MLLSRFLTASLISNRNGPMRYLTSAINASAASARFVARTLSSSSSIAKHCPAKHNLSVPKGGLFSNAPSSLGRNHLLTGGIPDTMGIGASNSTSKACSGPAPVSLAAFLCPESRSGVRRIQYPKGEEARLSTCRFETPGYDGRRKAVSLREW